MARGSLGIHAAAGGVGLAAGGRSAARLAGEQAEHGDHERRAAQDQAQRERGFRDAVGPVHEHWSKIRSTNPLERVNREIARRSDVVGIYPDDASLLRLAAGVLVEINDEWLVQHRYISHASMALILPNCENGPCGPVGADQPALEGALAGAGKSTT